MKYISIIISIITLVFSSCTITQEYHFNKDFSGNTKLSIDMGSFMEMMSGMDSTGNSMENMKDSLSFVFKDNAEKLDSLGIKNINYGWEEGTKVFYLSYDFENPEVLNKALNASSPQGTAIGNIADKEPHVYFSKKGKKTLIYKGPKSDKDISNNKDMETMKDYYKYAVIFTFDRKIKNVDNPNINLSPDNKRAELKGSMFEIIRPEYNSDITFKLK